jgi:hypothetical protein
MMLNGLRGIKKTIVKFSGSLSFVADNKDRNYILKRRNEKTHITDNFLVTK